MDIQQILTQATLTVLDKHGWPDTHAATIVEFIVNPTERALQYTNKKNPRAWARQNLVNQVAEDNHELASSLSDLIYCGRISIKILLRDATMQETLTALGTQHPQGVNIVQQALKTVKTLVLPEGKIQPGYVMLTTDQLPAKSYPDGVVITCDLDPPKCEIVASAKMYPVWQQLPEGWFFAYTPVNRTFQNLLG